MTEQRRSLKNVKRTQRLHLAYMGTQLGFSLMLVFAIWGLVVFRIYELVGTGRDLPYQQIAVIVTLSATLVALLAAASALLAAHRIGGVHVKLCQVFQQVQDGDLSTRLKFRATDQLEEVEDSFNKMMETLERRANAT